MPAVASASKLPVWQLGAPELQADDKALTTSVIGLHEDLYRRNFSEEMLANHNLPIQVRAFRHTENWRIFLVLCPWILARYFVPTGDPQIPLPKGWSAEERADEPYILLGPMISFDLFATEQKAHLNYHPILGHYLLQPLVLSLGQYENADAVFEAWNQVIRTRKENMEKHKRRSQWQEELSRREFFARLTAGREQ